jgi:predicted amidophosphoribosyltransferase
VAKSLGLADLSQALLKARNTLPQKELTSLAKKRANVRGAFRIARCEAVKGQSLLILDDLYDSGITLNEVCQTVRKAGAKAVYALALTRTIHVEK